MKPDEVGWTPQFEPKEEPTEQSLQLVSWLREMADSSKAMHMPDPSPLSDSPREYLFACAKDEFNLSSGLNKDSGEGESVRGRGWVDFARDSLCQKSFQVARAEGDFVDGKLEGEGTVTFVDDSFMRANFRAGVLHGLVRKFWCRFGPCDAFDLKAWSEPRHLEEVSWFRDGRRVGHAWEAKIGGGWVVGEVDRDGQLSSYGDEDDGLHAYLYPDMYTAMVGQFRQGGMVQARESRLNRVHIDPGESVGDLRVHLFYNSLCF